MSAGARNAGLRQTTKPSARIVNANELLRLKAEGASLRQTAEKLGIGKGVYGSGCATLQWKRHLNNDNRAEMFPRPILCVSAMD